MRFRRRYLYGLLLVALFPLAWTIWQLWPAGSNEPSVAVTLASRSTMLLSPSATMALNGPTRATVTTQTATPTATPSAALFVTPSRSLPPTYTPLLSAAATLVPTAFPIPDEVDRTCPDPAPGLPEYNRYYLSGRVWPTPDPSVSTHFLLASPFSGGEPLRITEWLPYGYDAGGRYLLHNGVDSAEPLGTPVLAAADGMVAVAGDDMSALYGWRCNWYGHLVVIALDQSWLGEPVFLLYGHVLEITVSPGQLVKRGDQLAEVGYGGAASAPHLHFEVRVGRNTFGATRNPLLWLDPTADQGVIAGRLVDPLGRPWQGVPIQVLGPGTESELRTTWTYLDDPQHLINPDEGLAENFALANLQPGEYRLSVVLQGEMYQQFVEVKGGQLSTVEIVTEPFKTATPVAE